MQARILILVGIGLVLALVCVGNRVFSSPQLPMPREDKSVALPGGPKYLGVGSCAAAACHGGPGPMGSAGCEYPTWVSEDEHMRAYAVLFDPRSQNMGKFRRQNAHEDALCLSCHVHPQAKNMEPASPSFQAFAREGVSCETCHGPAEKWLAAHHTSEWKGLSAKEKIQQGMVDTRSLSARIQSCLPCHVGTPENNVNHDLIALGHPRLNFEFSGFHASWKRHWPDRLDKDEKYGGYPDFEARGWVLGQIDSEIAAGVLRKHRPNDLSEKDCYACHHDLKAESWRQNEKRKGNIPWNTWYAAQRDNAKAVVNTMDSVALYKAVTDTNLGQATNWDDAVQVYLALAAIHNSWTDQKKLGPGSEFRKELVNWRGELRFPAGYDSPRNFVPRAIDQRLKQFQLGDR